MHISKQSEEVLELKESYFTLTIILPLILTALCFLIFKLFNLNYLVANIIGFLVFVIPGLIFERTGIIIRAEKTKGIVRIIKAIGGFDTWDDIYLSSIKSITITSHKRVFFIPYLKLTFNLNGNKKSYNFSFLNDKQESREHIKELSKYIGVPLEEIKI